jgi:uncharacterized membrane protein
MEFQVSSGEDHNQDEVLKRLQIDVIKWQRSGVITDDQVTAILGYYDDQIPSVRRLDYARLSSIFATMGAMLVGVGLILLVGANWQDIPLISRFVLMCTSMLVCNGMGYFLLYSRGYFRLGEAVFLLGGLAFGAGVFLAFQAYSYDAQPPLLLFWWCIGVTPLAYILGLRSVLLLGLCLFVVTFIWFTGNLGGDIESATGFVGLITVLGSVLFAVGTLHRLLGGGLARFSEIYTATGTGMLVVALYVLSFEGFLENDSLDSVNENYLGNFIPIGGLSCLALMCWAPYLVGIGRKIKLRATLVLDITAIPGGIVVATTAYWAGMVGDSVIFAAVFNAMLIVVIIAIIVVGVVKRKSYFINLGLVFFGVLIVTRYIDLMWGMLDGALLFITTGMLLLLVGFLLERMRRRLTKEFIWEDWK